MATVLHIHGARRWTLSVFQLQSWPTSLMLMTELYHLRSPLTADPTRVHKMKNKLQLISICTLISLRTSCVQIHIYIVYIYTTYQRIGRPYTMEYSHLLYWGKWMQFRLGSYNLYIAVIMHRFSSLSCSQSYRLCIVLIVKANSITISICLTFFGC